MMDWKEIKKQPQLKDVKLFQQNVLMAIEANEKKHVNHVGWRIAASIIVMLSVGSYSWMEFETYSLRSAKMTTINQSISNDLEDYNCQYQISHLIDNLREAGFIIDTEKKAIQFTQDDVKKLKDENSPYIADINQFIEGMEKLYPMKYQKFHAGEIVEFNSYHLRNDQRLCDWIR